MKGKVQKFNFETGKSETWLEVDSTAKSFDQIVSELYGHMKYFNSVLVGLEERIKALESIRGVREGTEAETPHGDS